MAVGPNRGQEVRVNGPIGAPGQMRMDVGFPGQPGPGMGLQNLYLNHKCTLLENIYCILLLVYNDLIFTCSLRSSKNG